MKLLQIIISTFVFIVQFTIVSASPVPLCKDGSRMFNHEVSALISRNAPQYRLHELEHYGKSEDNKYDCYYPYLGPIEHAAVIIYFDDEKIYAKKIRINIPVVTDIDIDENLIQIFHFLLIFNRNLIT